MLGLAACFPGCICFSSTTHACVLQAFRPGTKIVLQGGCAVFKNGCISQTGIPSEISLQTVSKNDGTSAHWETVQVGTVDVLL